MNPFGNRKHCLSISILFLASMLGASRISPETAYNHLTNSNWEQAIIAYETMLTTETENPQFHFNLGIAYFHTYRFSSAQREFESALLLNIEEPVFQARAEYNLGVTLFEQAKLYAAIDELRSLDYLREAVLAFESTLELQPESEPAAKNLQICQQLLLTLEKQKDQSEEEDTSAQEASADSDQKPPQPSSPDEQQEAENPERRKESDPGQKTPSGTGDPSSARRSDNPETTDKVAGAPGSQRLDIQEALLLLDSIENNEKRITLSELLEPSEKADSDSEANW